MKRDSDAPFLMAMCCVPALSCIPKKANFREVNFVIGKYSDLRMVSNHCGQI
jgi:hypothetical protein